VIETVESLPSHRDILVLSMMNPESFTRPIQIRKNLGITMSECTRSLLRLQAKGLLISLGSKKYRKYMVSDRGIEMLTNAKQFYQEL
jgi:DNA-binding MarR family transcriptional regulator